MKPAYVVCHNTTDGRVTFEEPRTVDDCVARLLLARKLPGCAFILVVYAGSVQFLHADRFLEGVSSGEISDAESDQGLKPDGTFPLLLWFQSESDRRKFAATLEDSRPFHHWVPRYRHLLKGGQADDIGEATTLDMLFEPRDYSVVAPPIFFEGSTLPGDAAFARVKFFVAEMNAALSLDCVATAASFECRLWTLLAVAPWLSAHAASPIRDAATKGAR